MAYIKKKDRKPAEGGAVGGGESSVNEVRGPIKDMLAGGSDKDFLESLPEQTSSEDAGGSPEEMAPKKKYKKRTPKEETPSAPVDKRLERAKAKASGLGGAALVESGFKLSGHPLDSEETEDVEDQFYLIANKAGIDPSGSWLFVILYTIALLARLVLSRTDLGEQIRAFLAGVGKEEKKKDGAKEAPNQ